VGGTVGVAGTVIVAVASTVVAVGVVVGRTVVVGGTVVVSGTVVAEADSAPVNGSKAVDVPPGTVPTGTGTVAAPHAATSNRAAVHPAIHTVVPRPAPAMAAGADGSLLRRAFPI